MDLYSFVADLRSLMYEFYVMMTWWIVGMTMNSNFLNLNDCYEF